MGQQEACLEHLVHHVEVPVEREPPQPLQIGYSLTGTYKGRFDSRRFVQPCNLADVTVEQQLRGRLNGRRRRSCTNAYVCTLGAARTNRQAKRLWRGLSFLFEKPPTGWYVASNNTNTPPPPLC